MKINRRITFTLPNTEEGRAWADWYKRQVFVNVPVVERIRKRVITLTIDEKMDVYAWMKIPRWMQ